MVFIHKIIFFDKDKKNIRSYWKELSGLPFDLSFRHDTFENLIGKEKMHIAVAPTNSYLGMSGGIDKIYTKLFKDIEGKLRNKIIEKKYAIGGISYNGTNYILPLGRAIICETGHTKCHYVLASPTMLTPRDINGSDNVYVCMKAVLKKINKIKTPIIILCPCLGTGIGNIPAETSAKQIKDALLEFFNVKLENAEIF